MEGEVVLAHEVVRLGGRVGPPGSPGIRVAGAPGPLDRCREIADDSVEPHVQPLVRVVDPAVQRDGNPPVDVAGHGTRADVVQQVEAELEHVRPPVCARLEPRAQRVGEGRQVEEEVLGLDELRRLAVDAAVWVDELSGVQLVAAAVALVASGAVVAADRARALDVAVGKGAARAGADGAVRRPGHHVAVAVQGAEHLLRDCVVVAGRRAGEQVVGEPERGEVLDDDPVVPVGELLRPGALVLRLHEDGRPVLVRPAHHEHVVAGHAHVPAEHVRGDAEAGDVADVPGAVGVGPCHGGQNVRRHGEQGTGRGRVGPRPTSPPSATPPLR